jgi:hypothetical protein
MRWFGVFVLLVVTGCAAPEVAEPAAAGSSANQLEDTAPVGVSAVQDTPFTMSDTIITAIRDGDLAMLAGFVHPDYGLRFSPMGRLAADDQVFSAAHVAALLDDETVYRWGNDDGSGNPIELTPREYWQAFVYSQDFLNAERVRYLQPFLNREWDDPSLERYADALVVEYHFSGFDPQAGGRDWESLFLVFQIHEDTWYISAIMHDRRRI